MRVILGDARRGPLISAWILGAAVFLLAAAVMSGQSLRVPGAVIGLVIVGTITHRFFAARLAPTWPNLLALIILVICFIPIRRYSMPGHLPFQLEPYRLTVAAVALGWLFSLLADYRVRLRKTMVDGPLAAIAIAAVLSIAANVHRINELGVSGTVAKKLTFLLSYMIVLYLFASVIHRRSDVDRLLRVLVGGGAFVAFAGLVEFRTHFNVFDHLSTVMPFLRLEDRLTSADVGRGGHHRIYGSAQHPIALGAMLVMLIPLTVYLARSTGRRRWWWSTAVILMAALATLSRTGVVMLVVSILVFLWLRPKETRKLWPLLLPAFLAVHIALPGTIGTFKDSFFPKGGLIASQEVGKGGSGQGRVADLGPAFKEFGNRPVLGAGYGTRIVDGPTPNAQIYDNEWLSTLVEIGALGVFSWGWLFFRSVRRLGRKAKGDDSHDGLLFTSLAASIASFGVGMFTFDAFSFIQVTFVLFIVLGIGNAALTAAESGRPSAPRRRLRQQLAE